MITLFLLLTLSFINVDAFSCVKGRKFSSFNCAINKQRDDCCFTDFQSQSDFEDYYKTISSGSSEDEVTLLLQKNRNKSILLIGTAHISQASGR